MNSITLPARCDRAATEAVWPELVAAMGDGATKIDGSGVEHIGQAMLQLLVSARRSGAGATISASPTLQEAAALTGLSTELFEESDI